jgi:cysteinyl-tRNA synthetase
MNIQLHNTLSGKKEAFSPINPGIVGMYHCGPTVYNYPHIGNLRAYVFADTLKRLMLASGYAVNQVINITDVGHLVGDADQGEDKMEKARKTERKPAHEIADFYTGVFMDNLSALNINTDGTKFPKATEYIPEQIEIVKTLEAKGMTYRTADGIYFDTSKFPAYGKLGNIDLAGIREGERIGVNDEKRNATDFALWKFSPAATADGEKREQEWESPWGVGFPGWHVECSAMGMKLLGETFDVHTGGIDHIPVHHNNEIAQSEGATGKPFVHYWMHSAFLTIAGGKMAKSEGNFLTLASITDRDISPLAYRYFLLGARYSTPVNFTWEALEASQTAYAKLIALVGSYPEGGTAQADLWDKALALVSDDLDTPKALALVWDTVRSADIDPADKKATILKIDNLLGCIEAGVRLDAESKEDTMIPIEIIMMQKRRDIARANKDWKVSDELRDEIARKGYEVKDTEEGQKIRKI